MSQFLRLSQLLLRYHRRLREMPDLLAADRRTGAGMLAAAEHGPIVLSMPALLNSAGLALAQERLVVHQLDAAAIQQVAETDARTLPAAPPRLLQQGFCIETADLSRPLFADVVCLGGYSIEGDARILAVRFPDGVVVGHWQPRWGDSDLDGSLLNEPSPFVALDDRDPYRDLTLQGVRFALTLGALLDAVGTPLESRAERVTTGLPKRQPAPKKSAPYTWSVRHITLTSGAAPVRARPESASGQPATPREGLHPEKRLVRGFLRRQPHGPGRAERKWVYVASFEAVRYVGEKPVRVVVTGEEETA